MSLQEETCCFADSSRLEFTEEATTSWVDSNLKSTPGNQPAAAAFGGAGASERKAREQLKLIKRISNDFMRKALKMGPMAKVEMDGIEIRVLKMNKRAASWDIRELETAITVFLSTIVRRIGKENSVILEPIMKLQIHLTDSKYSSDIMSNLSQKQALSVEMETPDERTTEVTAVVPLRFITKYSKEARAVAKGNIYFWSELAFFRKITDSNLEARILKTLT
jgi:translation elongation factor EF-G